MRYDIVLLTSRRKDGRPPYYWSVYKRNVEGMTEARAIACKTVKGKMGYEAYICRPNAKVRENNTIDADILEVVMNAYVPNTNDFDGCVIDRDYTAKGENPYRRYMRVNDKGRIWIDKKMWS